MSDHPAKAPQEKVCGYEYTVRRGDSFYLIANRLGVPLRDLLEANSDINPARLTVGDVLCIPMEEDDAPPEETPVPEEKPIPEEVPVPEETPVPEEAPMPEETEDLDVPAREDPCPAGRPHTVAEGETAADVQLRADLNRYTLQLANPTADLEQLTPGQVLCVPDRNAACPVQKQYVLQPGDTIESAALRLNVSLGTLLRLNPCLAPSDFTAGQRIILP